MVVFEKDLELVEAYINLLLLRARFDLIELVEESLGVLVDHVVRLHDHLLDFLWDCQDALSGDRIQIAAGELKFLKHLHGIAELYLLLCFIESGREECVRREPFLIN